MLFRRLKIKAKVPRPENVLADKEEQAAYKKFAARMNSKEFYFQDEMRFGTRIELARKWTTKGFRPFGEHRIGYEYGYLSVAVNPLTGETFVLVTVRYANNEFSSLHQ